MDEFGRPLISFDKKLPLGWLDSPRDWGRAKAHVEAMWLMLQRDPSKDYVIGANTMRST